MPKCILRLQMGKLLIRAKPLFFCLVHGRFPSPELGNLQHVAVNQNIEKVTNPFHTIYPQVIHMWRTRSGEHCRRPWNTLRIADCTPSGYSPRYCE